MESYRLGPSSMLSNQATRGQIYPRFPVQSMATWVSKPKVSKNNVVCATLFSLLLFKTLIDMSITSLPVDLNTGAKTWMVVDRLSPLQYLWLWEANVFVCTKFEANKLGRKQIKIWNEHGGNKPCIRQIGFQVSLHVSEAWALDPGKFSEFYRACSANILLLHPSPPLILWLVSEDPHIQGYSFPHFKLMGRLGLASNLELPAGGQGSLLIKKKLNCRSAGHFSGRLGRISFVFPQREERDIG